MPNVSNYADSKKTVGVVLRKVIRLYVYHLVILYSLP